MDFRITLLFTYGALTDGQSDHDFEPRVRDYWLPWAQKNNISLTPELVLFGTWTPIPHSFVTSESYMILVSIWHLGYPWPAQEPRTERSR